MSRHVVKLEYFFKFQMIVKMEIQNFVGLRLPTLLHRNKNKAHVNFI